LTKSKIPVPNLAISRKISRIGPNPRRLRGSSYAHIREDSAPDSDLATLLMSRMAFYS